MDLITNYAYGKWPVENREKKAPAHSFFYAMEQASWYLALMHNELREAAYVHDHWTERVWRRMVEYDEAQIEAERAEDPEIFRYRELTARLEEWDW